MPCERAERTERARQCPFAPFTGRRWRQPDEGLVSANSPTGMSSDNKYYPDAENAFVENLRQSRAGARPFAGRRRRAGRRPARPW
ncbi:hypothetical protein GFL88_23495 [Rhizobium leguminosarum bv. viciae]|nr:hypothetical protein [Rhizobium leguminosarum bv. viciae]